MVIESTSPTSLLTSTIVSMKTPPLMSIIFSAPLMAAPATPSMIMTTKVTETSPLGFTHLLRVIEVEKEFVVLLVDNIYKSLGMPFTGLERFNHSILVLESDSLSGY